MVSIETEEIFGEHWMYCDTVEGPEAAWDNFRIYWTNLINSDMIDRIIGELGDWRI